MNEHINAVVGTDFTQEIGACLTPKQMKRLERQAKRQMKKAAQENAFRGHAANTELPRKTTYNPKPLLPKTEKQADLIHSINSNAQTVVYGSAGTGKTFVSAAIACDMLMNGQVEKIILTRPNVPAGRSLGFFPGTLEEKMGPWVAPFTEVFKERMGSAAYEAQIRLGNIEIVPFEVIRGRTFNDAFVLLDEGQNTSQEEMKALVTRVGENSTLVINGDVKQSDIPEKSGLQMMIDYVNKYNYMRKKVGVVEFTVDDVVRSDICADWVRIFDKS